MKSKEHAKYLGQQSTSSGVIVQTWTHTHRQTDTPDRLLDLFTEVVSKY